MGSPNKPSRHRPAFFKSRNRLIPKMLPTIIVYVKKMQTLHDIKR